ncbi:hypothetical protein LUZ60_013022 [Juncus effusus]|nr:hypothetical protein LUZ60_013022 [Juncus effusus]
MTQTQSHSTRWSPTPEQLMLLEEMYRNGVRTPNATQIQQITAQLSRYGRIQGKNVFYWFQNHKARERQKIRRWLSRVYGGFGGPRNHFPYSQFHPLIFPSSSSSSQFQAQSVVHPADGVFQSIENAFHIVPDQGEENEDDPNFCYICSKLKQGFSEESVKQEWMAMMASEASIQGCRGPLRTLELFPTNGTDLKDFNNSQNCHQVMLPAIQVDEPIV